MTVGGARRHVVQRVADVGVSHFVEPNRVRIVGLDRDQRDSAVFVVCGQLLDAALVKLRRRAMIAGKRDDQNFTRRVFLQAVRLPVDCRETEIRSGAATTPG
jgi:hypothetical protein